MCRQFVTKNRAFANFSHIFFGSTDHTQRPASARGGARGFPVPGLPDPSEGGAAAEFCVEIVAVLVAGQLHQKKNEKWLEYDGRIYWKKNVDVFNAEKIDQPGAGEFDMDYSLHFQRSFTPRQSFPSRRLGALWLAILQVYGRLKDVAMLPSSTNTFNLPRFHRHIHSCTQKFP